MFKFFFFINYLSILISIHSNNCKYITKYCDKKYRNKTLYYFILII